MDISGEMTIPPPLRNPMTCSHYGGLVRLVNHVLRDNPIDPGNEAKSVVFVVFREISQMRRAWLGGGVGSTLGDDSGTVGGPDRALDAFVLPPGIPLQSKRFAIRTYGCQMNVHDSEKVTTLLEESGLRAASSEADADVLVINTCSIRD